MQNAIVPSNHLNKCYGNNAGALNTLKIEKKEKILNIIIKA